MQMKDNDILLSVRGLEKRFETKSGVVKAVDDVSFEVRRGEIIGIVGESGSGKTTVGRAILRLIEPNKGEALFDGVDLFKLSEKELRTYRRRMQIIFQDPYSSLNPRMRVRDIIGEAIDTHALAKGKEREKRIEELLVRVGLSAEHGRRYPNEFSGGQRQRIGIARALAVEPELIIADEPVSALDVSVQAQVLNLIQALQRELNLTMVFISHDLTVVEYLCDQIVVLYLGKVMEQGPARSVYTSPRHPYTRALLATAPIPDPAARREKVILQGDIPSPLDPPSGCVFRTRCPYAIDACATTVPVREEIEPGHRVACIRHAELANER